MRYLFIIISILTTSCRSDGKKILWEETNRIITIEAEDGHFHAESGWSVERTYPGYKGNGYAIWRGAGDWGPEEKVYSAISDPRSIISYTFTINNPGTYYVKVVNRHLQKDGDNDVWTSVDQGPWGKTYDWQTGQWTLDERGEWAKYNFVQGKHLVQLAGRSAGFAVDQILIFEENSPIESLTQYLHVKDSTISSGG